MTEKPRIVRITRNRETGNAEDRRHELKRRKRRSRKTSRDTRFLESDDPGSRAMSSAVSAKSTKSILFAETGIQRGLRIPANYGYIGDTGSSAGTGLTARENWSITFPRSRVMTCLPRYPTRPTCPTGPIKVRGKPGIQRGLTARAL